jgi:phosphatidylserine/phosphatidylglycerophosphate/cardiolipin synthase-like enzyme
VFDFLNEALADDSLTLDVFAYDFDEPDVIRKLQQLGPRMRLFLDNSKDHVTPSKDGAPALEVDAMHLLQASAGDDNVKTGKFQRFAHDKVFVQRRGGKAVKVLSGSANFSVRGLYVQSNNVFVFDDERLAGLYAQAFDQAWDHPLGEFEASEIAAKWFDEERDGLPRLAASFAPHASANVSLDRVADAIKGATSSVLFSIMGVVQGSGRVLDEIRRLRERTELYAFGTTQNSSGDLKTTTPADPDSPFIPFEFIHQKVPEPFREEFRGGAGQVIHHKFVVCDFNTDKAVAFAGSSNLAGGGEEENGDNLVAFLDPEVATAYAIQALGLIDHYRFRSLQHASGDENPLRLKTRSETWAAEYFEPDNVRFRERLLFIG